MEVSLKGMQYSNPARCIYGTAVLCYLPETCCLPQETNHAQAISNPTSAKVPNTLNPQKHGGLKFLPFCKISDNLSIIFLQQEQVNQEKLRQENFSASVLVTWYSQNTTAFKGGSFGTH